MRRISGVAPLALALLSGALISLTPTGPRADAAGLTALPAMQADKVVDAYGVGVHLAYPDSPYADATKVAAALTDLGVRHVRDDLYLGNPGQYSAIRTVADRGVKFDLIMGRPDRPGTPEDYVDTVATQLPSGAVESVEGVNEWDYFSGGVLSWPTDLLAWQKRLFAATKANPATAGLPVLAPSLAFKADYPALVAAGDMAPYADKANGHMYPGGYEPANQVSLITAAIRTLIPSAPMVTTEAGYHNAVNTTNGHLPVSEDAAGVYLPRLLLDHVMRGEERMYSYELIDRLDEPGLTNPEAHFGLVRNDYSPKPAYVAMKTLLGLLSDPGPAFTPGSLQLSSTGWPSDGKYLVTQKRNGQFVLLMWRDARVYDPVARRPIDVTPANVTLQFGQRYDLGVYRPTAGPTPVSQARGSSLSLQLGPEVTAVTLDAVPPAPAPTSVTATAGNGTATVGWDLPSTTADVTGFEVVRQPGSVSTTVGPATRSFTDTGLVNGTSYSYTVRALSAEGSSATVTSPTVVPATTPSAPVIAGTTVRKGAVTLTWRRPANGGAAILGYQLVSGTKSLTVGPDVLQATLSGLSGSLRVGVRARNRVGWGPYTYTATLKVPRRTHR